MVISDTSGTIFDLAFSLKVIWKKAVLNKNWWWWWWLLCTPTTHNNISIHVSCRRRPLLLFIVIIITEENLLIIFFGDNQIVLMDPAEIMGLGALELGFFFYVFCVSQA